MTPTPGERRIEAVMSMGGPECEFAVERTPARTVARPDLTFSEEAMDALAGDIALWIVTRVKRAWDQKGSAPQRMVVTVRVELDGEPAP